MTTDPKTNIMLQVKARLLDKMGESGEIDGDELIIRGITEEEWSNKEKQSLVMDEPDVDPEVEQNGDTYTVRIDFSE